MMIPANTRRNLGVHGIQLVSVEGDQSLDLTLGLLSLRPLLLGDLWVDLDLG
jgi:hypothetical protein